MRNCATYQGAAATNDDGLVARGAVETLNVRAVGGGLAAQPELLACGVHLHVVDGRGGADGHDAERRVGLGGVHGRSSSSQQGKSERSSEGLHVGD